VNRFSALPARAGVRTAGVHLEVADRAARTVAPRFVSGVPAFVGIAAPEPGARGAGPTVSVAHRANAERLLLDLRRRATGFLALAVDGFFANGGERCLVIAAPPQLGGEGMAKAFAPGGLLDERSDFDLVCLPDAFSAAPDADDDRVAQAIEEAAQLAVAALAHCARMGDRFAILDAPPFGAPVGPLRANELKAYLSRLRKGQREDGPAALGGAEPTAYGALYFPWIAAASRDAEAAWSTTRPQWRRRGHVAEKSTVLMPACGHVAGLHARTDARVGAHRSAAKLSLDDVVDTSLALEDSELAVLNDAGVNGLAALGRDGVEIAAARTLSARREWRYVASVRVVAGFRRWLSVALRDVTFEPNTAFLWENVRLRLVARCLELMRAGALAGDRASDAFFVKCDAETNTAESVADGRIVAHVGLAPATPAEFIVVRIDHHEGGVTTTSL